MMRLAEGSNSVTSQGHPGLDGPLTRGIIRRVVGNPGGWPPHNTEDTDADIVQFMELSQDD